MEEHHKPGDNKFTTRKAEIAAAGNRPEDWRAYIEETKLNIKDQSFQTKRKYDIISYMYHSAFQGIPVSNTSFAHAQLLVDYATFKSDHSLEDAEKLLFHGRKYLRMHAIIHIASADLELRKGNRDKAVTILKRGSHFGAKPECLIREAKDRLGRNCTRLLRGDSKENESFDSTSGYNSSSSSGIELTGESCQAQLKNVDYGLDKDSHSINLPGCKSSTEEVQHGLDLISHYNKLSSSMSTPSLLPASTYMKGEKESLLNQQNQNVAKFHINSKGACNLVTRPFQDLMNTDNSNLRRHDNTNTATDPMFDNFDLSCDDQFPTEHNSGAVESLNNERLLPQRTPQTSGLKPSSVLSSVKKNNQGSAVKIQRWHSASALQESSKRPTTASKGKLLNLPPPQRVRVDQTSNTSSEESDGDEKGDIGLKNQSSAAHKVDMSSSSLTFGTDRLPRMHSKIFLPPSSSKKVSSTFQMITPLSTKKGHTGEAHCEESHIMEANKNDTSKVRKGIFTSVISEEKMSVCEPVIPSSSSGLGQHQVPSQSISYKDAPYRDDSQNNPLSVFQEQMASCNSRMPPSVGGKIEQVSSQKNCPGDEFRKNVMTAATADPLTAGCQPNGNEVLKPKTNEPRKATATAGATYSVPGHNQTQGVPKNMVTPAKQTVPGGQKTLYVNGKPYIVIKLIGRGGSAKVYQVQDPETLSMRALKCVNLSCERKEVLEGYKNEIALLEKLQHCDRVIKLFDSEYVESQKKLLVVMECGETNLADLIAQNAKKDELQSVTICYLWGHMVKAVQAMHKEGVIHSDLKPANFLLVSGTIKLIDFGIANSLQQDKTSVLKNHVMGTPNYMSPEALMASNADRSESKPKYKVGTRSDVWSLGCILYQMVYGHTPFQHVGFNLKFHAIVNPAHEIQFPPLEDAALMDILKKCLTRDVKQRPTTDDLMNHPYLTKQKLAKPSHPSRQNLMEIDDITSASPRTQREYYLKKAEEFQSMASSLVSKMENKDLTYNK